MKPNYNGPKLLARRCYPLVMNGDTEMITVFRSADTDAEEDARAIGELLTAQGIDAIVLDDSAPGVPAGAWEVRTSPADSGRAEEIIAEAPLPETELTEVSADPELEAVTVFRARSSVTSEMEATSVKGVLEASGIAAILVGDARLPNLPFEVRVAKDQLEEAERVLQQARAVGREAAEQEERASETPLNP
jgi:hypothetical protein